MCIHYYKCPECGYKWSRDSTHPTENHPNCHKYTNPLVPVRRFCGGSNGCVGKASSYIETNTESGPFDAIRNHIKTETLRAAYGGFSQNIGQDTLNNYRKNLDIMNSAQLNASPKLEEIKMNVSLLETNAKNTPFDALLDLYNADALRTTYDKSAYAIDQDRLNEYKKHLATMNRAQLTAPPKPEEIEMNIPLLETRTLVDGVDINKANKERLILMLKTLEKEEDDLAKIRTESKTITARIAEIAAARSAVATALDA